MTNHELESCPGCGAALPRGVGPVHRYLAPSPACWAAFGDVLAHEYSERLLQPAISWAGVP